MSAILEAVREELAKVEQEYEERLRPLREIEALAVSLNGGGGEEAEAESDSAPRSEPQSDAPAAEKSGSRRGDRALAAAKERRRSAAGSSAERAAPRKVSDDDIEAAAFAVLPAGGATPNKVLGHLGTKSENTRRRCEQLFARLEADGRIVPDTPIRGRASFKLADQGGPDPSPEPPAPAPKPDDAGATSDSGASDEVEEEEASSDSGASDEVETSEPEWVSDDELEDYKPSAGRTGRQVIEPELQALADRIVEATTLESKSTIEIAEILGEEDVKQIRRVTEKLARMGRLQERGYNSEGKPRYRRTPSLEAQGVDVKQADRESPIETQVLAAIDEHGALSIPALATKTVRHPRDVAAAVTALIARREIKKTRSHPDAVYERLVPEATWDRGLKV